MGLETHQHFKVRSRYFSNKEISAVIFVSFPTCYPIRAVTGVYITYLVNYFIKPWRLLPTSFPFTIFWLSYSADVDSGFQLYTKPLAGLTDPDVSEESDKLWFLRNTSSKAIISLRRRVVSSHISTQTGEPPLVRLSIPPCKPPDLLVVSIADLNMRCDVVKRKQFDVS